MKTSIIFYLAFSLFLFSGCLQNEKKPKENVASNIKTGSQYKLLIHNVFLDLKDNVSADDKIKAIEQLKSLSAIDNVVKLYAGPKAETGDTRLYKNYDLALHVTFKSLDDLKKYDKNEHHAKVRRQLKSLLAGPPLVFDYWTE